MNKTFGFNTVNQRYQRVFWPMMAVYVVIIQAASFFMDKETAPVWMKAF